MKTDCFKCQYKLTIPEDCHISCNKPDWGMTGVKQAIEKGWFLYPINFDPVWRSKECDNFKEIGDEL